MKFIKSNQLLVVITTLALTLLITINGFQFKSKSRKLESGSKYKFYLMNSEFTPDSKVITEGLNNMSLSDLSPCKAMNSTINGTQNPPFNTTEVCTDAAGASKKNMTVNSDAPFTVTSCDQVLYIQGAKYLKDYDDCSSRESAFFTMSMYMVNFFKEKNPSTLKRSILIEDMTILPTFVPGSRKECLDFVNTKTPGSFSICFDDKQITASIYASFMNFMKCRMGDNLKPLSLSQLKRTYELTCGGNPIDPKIFTSEAKEEVVSGINKNFEKMGLNPYYSKEVPGNAPPKTVFRKKIAD